MRTASATLLLLGMTALAHGAPANPNASPKARQVLTYLQGLSQKANNRVLSGQNAGMGSNAVAGFTNYVEKLQQQTGKWVALLGADYGFDVDPAAITQANQTLKKHWQAGGLVTVSFHFANPFTGGDSWDTSGVDLAALTDPSSWIYPKWKGWLDQLAAGLADLKSAGVVVLWRPFHEMNGNWFWWSMDGGSRASKGSFVALWQQMFDYFTKTKQLDNLLWVYSVNVQLSTYLKPVAHYYPGNNLVDVVGIDYYRDDTDDLDANGSYTSLAALGKPVAITEIGAKNQRDGSFDNTVIIKGIKAHTPKAVWWLTWHSWPGASVAMADCQNAAALINDPWVVTRDEIQLPDPDAGPIPVDSSPTMKEGGPPPADGGGGQPDAAIPAGDGDGRQPGSSDDGCSCSFGRKAPAGPLPVLVLLLLLLLPRCRSS